MSWGYLTIGRIPLRETYTISDQVNASNGERTLTMTGVEYYPGTPYAEVHARREDLMGIRGEMVGVSFSAKPQFDGFYTVKDLGAVVTDWKAKDEAASLRWNATLSLIGPANAVDVESRLTGIARTNDFAEAGERWHAPAGGALAYWVGTGGPSGSMTRNLDTGSTIRVYRGIPVGMDPVWGVSTPAGLLAGRTRVLIDGLERYGTRVKGSATGWEISNGLVRVRPSATAGATIEVAAWGGSWETKDWDINPGPAVLTPASLLGTTVLRNDVEAVTIRLLFQDSASKRGLLDLVLRRGSRFVEGFMQVPDSATLIATLHTLETSTKTSGYVAANANDGQGNKAWSASAKAFTLQANGGVSKATATTLDFALGVVLDGTGAVSGDTADVLYKQYIGALPESTMGVLR